MSEGNDAKEHRRHARKSDPHALVWLDPCDVESGAIEGFVGLAIPQYMDESESGIALAFDRRPEFELGQQVALTHNGRTRLAIVRNLIALESGQFRVGFEWCDPVTAAGNG